MYRLAVCDSDIKIDFFDRLKILILIVMTFCDKILEKKERYKIYINVLVINVPRTSIISYFRSCRATLTTNVILQKCNLDHLKNEFRLYLYGDRKINSTDNRIILLWQLNI